MDDGSPDGTAAIVEAIIADESTRAHSAAAQENGAGHRVPRGLPLGRSSSEYDMLFEMDADFSHDPGHLPDFLRAIEEHDLVLGSRYRDGKGDRRQLADRQADPQLLRERLRASGDRTAGLGRDRWLQVLSPSTFWNRLI